MLAIRIYRLGSRLLPALPEGLIYGTCEMLGLLALLFSPTMRQAVLANVQRIAPRRRGPRRLMLAQQVVAHVCKNYADLMRLPRMSQAELGRRFEFVGLAQIRRVLAAGKGAVIAVPHCGSYSVVMAALADQGWKMTLVVEQVRPPEMLEVLNGLRRRDNLTVVPLGPEAGRELLRALRRGELVVLAADRPLADQQINIAFFGEPAPLPAGPATLACRGIPIFTAFTARLWGSRSLGYVEQLAMPGGEECVEQVTCRIARRFEDYIRRFPESWGVLQPVWPARRT